MLFYQKELFSPEITWWTRLLRNQFLTQDPRNALSYL